MASSSSSACALVQPVAHKEAQHGEGHGGLITLLGSGTVLSPHIFEHSQDTNTDIPTAVIDINAVVPETTATSITTQIGKDVLMVVDVSGSMSSAMDSVKGTILQVVGTLNKDDRIAMITFGTDAKVVFGFICPFNDETVQLSIEKRVAELQADGYTNMSDGMLNALNVVATDSVADHDSSAALNNTVSKPGKLTMCLLLSDGEPNKGIYGAVPLVEAIRGTVAKLNQKPVIPQVVVHSFGYTTGHKATLLRDLTTTGNGGNGMYYFLRTTEDIKTAVGDCLGSATNVHLYGLRLTAVPLGSNGEIVPGWSCTFYDGKGLPSHANASPSSLQIGYISISEKRNVIAFARPTSGSSGGDTTTKKGSNLDTPVASILVRAYYNNPATASSCEESFQCVVLQGGSSNPDIIAQLLHVQTHVLRLRVSSSLQILSTQTAARGRDTAPYEQLHELLLQTLSAVQEASANSPLPTLVEDESLLMSLEKDFGEVVEQALRGAAVSTQDHMRMQQYSHEHANQRSASCATELRATYSTPEQAAMRAQFGCASDADALKKIEAAAKDEKEKLVLEEAGITAEQKAKRMTVDEDIACFVTLENWRAANIGIGILVQPRTMRERYRRLIPQLELVNDYISADAYNQGARTLATRAGAHDRDKAGNQHVVLASSTRGRINAWLPLYINATNWKYTKAWAPSAFSIIACQVNDKFQPIHAVQVCARLLNHSVVKFMNGDLHLSDKSLQQYADVHRLFLEMVVEYPTIRQTASKALEDFVEKPWVRGREMTPDIGDLIQYLTVTDTVTWEAFKSAYIEESFRRNARWVDSRVPGGEARNIGPHSTDEELVGYWSEGTRLSTKLMLFNVMFLNLVARPDGVSLDDVRSEYDKFWGRLTEGLVEKIKIEALEIAKIETLQEVMNRINLPSDVASIAKLIRCAYENKQEIPIPSELKTAENNDASRAQYKTYVHTRSVASIVANSIQSMQSFANKRSDTLRTFFSGLLVSSTILLHNQRSIHLQDVWKNPEALSITDRLMTFLREKNVDAQLIAAYGHTVISRAHALGVPAKYVLKEMVFSTGADKQVLVISNGDNLIDLRALSKAFTGTYSLSSVVKIAAATGFPSVSISAFCTEIAHNSSNSNTQNNTPANNSSNIAIDKDANTAIAAIKTLMPTVLNETVVDLGADTKVYMSAGCNGVLMRISVGELQRLLPHAVVLSC